MSDDVAGAKADVDAARALARQAAQCREHLVAALVLVTDPRTEQAILTAIRRQTELQLIVREAVRFREAHAQLVEATSLTTGRDLG